MSSGIPSWASEPFNRFLDYLEDSSRLVGASMRGIAGLRGMPKAIEVLSKYREGEHRKPEAMLIAKEYAAIAETEIECGFPLLHAHAIVGLWSALEVLIEDEAIAWLTNEPNLVEKECFSRQRVPFAEFERLDREERLRLLLAEVQRSVDPRRKVGVDHFEATLDLIGLSGAVDGAVKKDLFELHHVRNVIVHRGGIADRRLVEGCPWMGLSIGAPVRVTTASFKRYSDALCWYVGTIIDRICGRLGLPPQSRELGLVPSRADAPCNPVEER